MYLFRLPRKIEILVRRGVQRTSAQQHYGKETMILGFHERIAKQGVRSILPPVVQVVEKMEIKGRDRGGAGSKATGSLLRVIYFVSWEESESVREGT